MTCFRLPSHFPRLDFQPAHLGSTRRRHIQSLPARGYVDHVLPDVRVRQCVLIQNEPWSSSVPSVNPGSPI
jgi:hypothetical protein